MDSRVSGNACGTDKDAAVADWSPNAESGADQILVTSDVIRAVRERVQFCQDPQTEFALIRESLGVSSVIHIFTVQDLEQNFG